jgi:DNA-binding NtrC family response regulator
MNILVVDDEKNIRKVLKMIIEDLGYNFYGAENTKKADSKLKQENINLIILDIKMPQKNGIDYLKEIKTKHPNIPVLMLTAHGNVSIAVDSMKIGAVDFLEKNGNEKSIKDKILNILDKQKHISKKNYNNLVVEDKKMIKIMEETNRVAKKDINILLKGESGVGKEEIAKYISKISDRSDDKFYPINCGAIPEPLFESEMFGYEKGAFTGASEQKKGIFEKVDGGILFLDEICELNIRSQVALLRVLEDKKFYRLGGKKGIKSDFRIISATNQKIERLVNNNKFRKDLFFRINSYEIEIPPLRKRKDDIIPLANYYIDYFSKKYDIEQKLLHDDLKKFLKNYIWKGNVR